MPTTVSRRRQSAALPPPPPSTKVAPTLFDTFQHTCDHRWEIIRARDVTMGIARRAVLWFMETTALDVRAEDITPDMVRAYVRHLQASGLAASTIIRHLGTMSVLGVNTRGCWPKVPKPRKWWLKPDQQARLTAYLRSPETPVRTSGCRSNMPHAMMADLVDLMTYTGVRVEEALRFVRSDFMLHPHNGTMSATVPGTKTDIAQKTLAISTAAQRVIEQRLASVDPEADTKLFPVPYLAAARHWSDVCRPFLGIDPKEVHGATLKALRRTAARHLTVNGMPTDVLKDYLRHTNIKTTEGYLHLTGGYESEETRKWLP